MESRREPRGVTRRTGGRTALNAETAGLFHPRIIQTRFCLCGLTQALYMAHGLTISESAFERHTNKYGFRSVFRVARGWLAVQK
jgi:hypothetical protein